MAAVGQRWPETGGAVHPGDEAAGTQNGAQAIDQRDIVEVGGGLGANPTRIVVTQRQGVYRHGGVDRSLE